MSPAITRNKDFSDLKLYKFFVIKKTESGKEDYKYESILAANPQDVRQKVAKLFKGYEFHEGYGIQEEKAPAGKFNCPNCKSNLTVCKRDIGCAIMIIIFVSLGLGLIMVPFLPNHCTCRLCGYKWKA